MISLTLILVILTCLISYQAMNDRAMKEKLLMHPASVHEFGQWYRLLTSGFVHKDWMHLGINMYVLWMFGEGLESYFLGHFGNLQGRIFYILLYFAAIIVSSLPAYLQHKNNQYYSSLGASGGVSAVLFALILFAPWAGISFIFFPFVDIPFIIFGVLYMIYETYMSKKGTDMIGHDAHIAGAVFGILGTLLIAFIAKPELINVFIFNITNPSFFLAG